MSPAQRSLSGLVLAIFSIPVFMGLVACIPAGPMIGDPERARIDPSLNGFWVDPREEAVLYFRPWDKRSWLVAFAGFGIDEENCPVPHDDLGNPLLLTYEELVELDESSDFSCLEFDGEVALYKAWRTEIGGEWFMTWELKGLFDEEDGYGPVLWFSFRERRDNPDMLVMEFIDFTHDKFTEHEELAAFEDLEPPFDPKTLKDARKVAERVIRRNVHDEELYEADNGLSLRRVPAEHVEIFENVIGDAIGNL